MKPLPTRTERHASALPHLGDDMARPRVFISSTFYDLKHVRASMDLFVRSLGFDSVLSEKGDIAYSFDRALDESCYAEVNNSDIFVLIVGGRYGSSASDDDDPKKRRTFFDRYQSITQKEYERAVELDLPIYILMEKAVNAEYQTFRANRTNEAIKYVHVDSVNVFELIDFIVSRPRNNPIETFEKFTEVEDWLREQWAGLFRDLLKRAGQQAQLKALNEQVAQMRDLNETLKTYMETVVTSLSPDTSRALISTESDRRQAAQRIRTASSNDAIQFVADKLRLPARLIVDAVATADDLKTFYEALSSMASAEDASQLEEFGEWLDEPFEPFVRDINEVRNTLGLPPLALRPSPPRGSRRRANRVKEAEAEE